MSDRSRGSRTGNADAFEQRVAGNGNVSSRSEDVVRHLTTTYGAATRHFVFALIDPWTVYSGKIEAVLDVVRDAGFRLVAFRFGRLDHGDVVQMYRKDNPMTPRNRPGWHLLTEARTIGVSCGCLFYHEAPIDTCAADFRSVKGATLLSPGSLRQQLRAANGTLSVIHSSDDWARSIDEGLIVFPPDELERAFRLGATVGEDALAARLRSSTYRGQARITDRAATDLLVVLRLRIHDALLAHGSLVDLPELRDHWERYLETDHLSLDIEEEASRYCEFVGRERFLLDHHLQDVLTSTSVDWGPHPYGARTDTVDLLRTLILLNRVESYDRVNYNEVARRFPLFMDEWEALLFTSTFHHFHDIAHLDARSTGAPAPGTFSVSGATTAE